MFLGKKLSTLLRVHRGTQYVRTIYVVKQIIFNFQMVQFFIERFDLVLFEILQTQIYSIGHLVFLN